MEHPTAHGFTTSAQDFTYLRTLDGQKSIITYETGNGVPNDWANERTPDEADLRGEYDI